MNLSDLARSALDALKRALGIRSPSEVWIDDIRCAADEFDRGLNSRDPIESLPWYAAHHPRDPWRNDELKRKARLVRRDYRRADRRNS